MNLDNARNLKLEVLAQWNARSGELPYDPAISEVLSRSNHPGAGEFALPMIGVGIAPAPSGKGYHLALRLTDAVLSNSNQFQELCRKARNETDIRVIGTVCALAERRRWYRSRAKRLQSGISIGHFDSTMGTLGALVRLRKGGGLRILSNNHVLANLNQGRRGDPILQPCGCDGGTRPENIIGHLEIFKRISFTGANVLDAALATLAGSVQASPGTVRFIGPLRGVAKEDDLLEEHLIVKKLGRTTGLKRGRITAMEVDGLQVDYQLGRRALFNHQIEIESASRLPFSLSGDSGSLVVTEDGWAVGLLFAGTEGGGRNSPGLTYANPIHTVLDSLEVDLITQPD